MSRIESDGDRPPGDGLPWLDAEEREAWLGLMRMTARLPPLLDAQLERTAGLTLFEYTILAMLSEQEDETLRMSRLATLTNASPSRLSHAARQLEGRGLLHRVPDPADGRCIQAVLTGLGRDVVVGAAPGHVKTVRDVFVDALDPEGLRAFRSATEQILQRIDPDRTTRPPWIDEPAPLHPTRPDRSRGTTPWPSK